MRSRREASDSLASIFSVSRLHSLSPSSVRSFNAQGRIPGVFIPGGGLIRHVMSQDGTGCFNICVVNKQRRGSWADTVLCLEQTEIKKISKTRSLPPGRESSKHSTIDVHSYRHLTSWEKEGSLEEVA